MFNIEQAQIGNAVIFAVACGAGLGKSEIVKAERSDYNPETMELKVRKNRRSRSVPLAKKQGLVLNEWLKVRGNEKGFLFCPIFGKKRILKGASSIGGVYNLSKKTGSSSLRDLRHGYLSNLLASERDAGAIQHLVGCCSIRTILRYP